MFKGYIIKQLLEERKITKKRLFEYLNTSASGLDTIINKGNPTASTLEKIADFFNVSVDTFFERNIENIPSNINIGHNITGLVNHVTGDITLSECQKELEHLKTLLQEKDKMIHEKDKQLEEKERLIQILMTK